MILFDIIFQIILYFINLQLIIFKRKFHNLLLLELYKKLIFYFIIFEMMNIHFN